MASKQKSVKSRRSRGFRTLLWEFKVNEIKIKVSQINQDDETHHPHKEGFNNLRIGFEEFLSENDLAYNKDFGYFKIYLSVTVESTDIIWTAENFCENECFSDVVISSEKTDWYGKVYIDTYFIIFINDSIKIFFSIHYITLLI